ETISDTTLNLAMTPENMANTETPAPTNVELSGGANTNDWISNPSTLWTAPAQSGEESNSATTNADTDLTIGRQPACIYAATDDATLFWALQAAPTATPAS